MVGNKTEHKSAVASSLYNFIGWIFLCVIVCLVVLSDRGIVANGFKFVKCKNQAMVLKKI